MTKEQTNLAMKAQMLAVEAAFEANGNSARPSRLDLAARLYDDAAGYWEAVGGRSMEAGECRRLAAECRKKAEGQ